MNETSPVYVFGLVADGMLALPRILRASFQHPWVASYQIGFGPPLVRATPELAELARDARDAIAKLDLYLEHCILDLDQCKRLATAQRRLLVRRQGTVEAEDLTRASADALDLSLRLHVPQTAPPRVRRSMKELGVPLDLVPRNVVPGALIGRFLIRLGDPRNERLLHVPAVAEAAGANDEQSLALELRVQVDHHELWRAFLDALAFIAPFTPVEVGDPAAHARVMRNGERS